MRFLSNHKFNHDRKGVKLTPLPNDGKFRRERNYRLNGNSVATVASNRNEENEWEDANKMHHQIASSPVNVAITSTFAALRTLANIPTRSSRSC